LVNALQGDPGIHADGCHENAPRFLPFVLTKAMQRGKVHRDRLID
jgi:hypothetical protein